ncbi:aldo-keto reductase-like protein [Pseudovirgaria hyperparasitica]|uniref:Aldo-keto reductase-like protein n=1 Tax=Pseudovirgaria hyperparasitica TaxID=470096 RepID=A0A6A6WJ04_9PEZI|nr:aldo-keto reductase-like protein [Pseudovirgaria hyperparasitica]KAF2762339.1 aldo-keto reductase-like protein [Pseudovirgaria hyperparasitica]
MSPSPDINTRFTLNNGTTIPALGLGTWQSSPGEVKQAVEHALKSGYRHIDAAYCYQNENEVGEGIKAAIASGAVKREDIFVTTKLWCTFHTRVEEGLDESLKNLGLDYVDLFLMHWPCPMNPKGNHPLFPKLEDGSRDLDVSTSHIETWKRMEKIPKEKTRAIGVSNYSKKYLEILLKHATTVPAVNQIENHPYLPQQEVVDTCRQNNILVTAYSPFGSTGSPLFNEVAVKSVADEHKVSPGTVLLSYAIARGIVVIPKSVTPSRIEENTKLIVLSGEELESLEKIHKEKGITRYVYPAFGVNFGFPDKAEGRILPGGE